MTEREQFERQENWKKIHAALEGYAALASHMNDEVCQSYCKEWQRALEAVKIAEEEENRVANLEQAARATPALPQGVEEWIGKNSKILTDHRDRYVTVIHAADLRAYLSGMAIVPVELTDEMLVAARDWSYKKYGQPIGNDAAKGCWQAILAAVKEPATCSVCGLKRSDTKNCKAPDCSPMLAAAKEKGE